MTQNNASENTRLLSASPPPPVNRATRPTASNDESGVMSTFRSVFQLVHGVGENVRGTVLGTIDDWENRGEQKHHDVARRGRAEIDEAFQRLWGTSGATAAQVQPSASTTGYDAAPPTYQTSGTGYGAANLNPDVKNGSGA
ncbi:hypothetical protein MVEN_01989400 [Mycena venus]|uniref:Uncharacterized protein n=1 Tax=Mycena venus TaxID=2733690 RepID=A0A8H6XEM3_9AGAR|nr:hypothetical protein MVEN_01989400 [Mycena venus]